jgi:hypothetical protein
MASTSAAPVSALVPLKLRSTGNACSGDVVALATVIDEVSAMAGAARPPARAAVSAVTMTAGIILRARRGTRCTGISGCPSLEMERLGCLQASAASPEGADGARRLSGAELRLRPADP